MDLAYALDDVDTKGEDYMLFGEVSLWVFPDLVSDIQRIHFFLGEWVDALTKAATNFMRGPGQCMAQRPESAGGWWMRIASGWGLAEVALDGAGNLARRALEFFSLRMATFLPLSLGSDPYSVPDGSPQSTGGKLCGCIWLASVGERRRFTCLRNQR